jgi:hypothetical protein
MLSVPTVADLAQFTGRAEDTFNTFAIQALAQATLMFTTVTQLDEYPTEADKLQLAVNGILQMTDRFYLEQPYQLVKASPFNSETIGSYTYSKGYTELTIKASRGELTGLFWWDLAVEELSLRSRSLVTSGSLATLDHDITTCPDGTQVIVGPADQQPTIGVPYADNYELNPRPRLG